MSTTIEWTKTFTVITCGTQGCGITFAMDDDFIAARREDHAAWYCPNGHGRYYPAENELEKTRQQLEAERQRSTRISARADQAQAEAEHQRRRAAAFKGAVTKARRRAGRGTCPFPGCRRHFDNLQAHMETKHPTYAESETP